jgi:hypothetical protein
MDAIQRQSPGSIFAEWVSKKKLNLRNFVHSKLSEFGFFRSLRKSSLILQEKAKQLVERTFRHINHVLDAVAKPVKVAKEVSFVRQVLFDGLAHAFIQELRMRCRVEESIEISRVVQYLHVARCVASHWTPEQQPEPFSWIRILCPLRARQIAFWSKTAGIVLADIALN